MRMRLTMREPGGLPFDPQSLAVWLRTLPPVGQYRNEQTGEFGWWKPTADSPEPEHPATREVVGEPKASFYAVTPEAVRNLAAFLEATGWTCLYGINMGTNTPARAAE